MSKLIQLKDNEGNVFPKHIEKYSTNEQKIGLWVDGKPIYRKVFVLNNYTSLQQGTLISCPISDIDEMIRYEVMYYYTSDSTWRNFPLVESAGNTLSCNYEKKHQSLQFAGKGMWSGTNRPMKFIAEYTKTTD